MKFKNLNLFKFWDRVYRGEYKTLNQFKLWDRVYRGNIKNINQFKFYRVYIKNLNQLMFWDSVYRGEYQVVAVFSWPSYSCSSLPSHYEILLAQEVCFAYRTQFQHFPLPPFSYREFSCVSPLLIILYYINIAWFFSVLRMAHNILPRCVESTWISPRMPLGINCLKPTLSK